MRTLLTVVIICSLQIYCLCNDNPFEDTRIMSRAYPHQKRIPIHRNIQILNAQKFIRARPMENHKFNNKNQHLPMDNESYTVFPSIALKVKKITSFPESPHFPIESLFDQKPNKIIKKMLPDYGLWHLSRRRRSASLVKITNSSKTTPKNNIQRTVNNKNKGPSNRDMLRASVKKQKIRTPESVKVSNVGNNIKNSNRSILRKRNIKKNLKTRNKVSKQLKKNLRNGRSRNNKNVKTRLKKGGNSRKQNKKNDAKRVKRSETGGQGRKVFNGRRLIAGKDASINEYPYVVSIQKDFEHWCAGALLNPRLVITTANCVWKSDRVSRLRVRAGSRHTDHGGEVAGVQEMMRHPRWSLRRLPDHDVALLLLDKNIKFSHEVHAVDLPNHSMMPSFEDAWISSWGSDRISVNGDDNVLLAEFEHGDNFPILSAVVNCAGDIVVPIVNLCQRDGIYENRQLTLQAYHARLMDRKKCNNITQRFGVHVTHNFICLSQIGRRAPCTRDTGAPAVSDGVLWGLASWGLRKLCGTERYPAMFSYIASLSNLEFITNATHLLMSDERFYPYPDRFRNFDLKALKLDHTVTAKAGHGMT